MVHFYDSYNDASNEILYNISGPSKAEQGHNGVFVITCLELQVCVPFRAKTKI